MPLGAGNKAGTLHVLATPIGNLEDLSPRAARVLKQATAVAAETLRRTRALLAHLGIRGKPLISCRESNRSKAAAEIIGVLGKGGDVALVTDGGSPGVSDPGAWVVREVVQAGYRVSPVPGPSALCAALSVAGLEGGAVLFAGFLPAKGGPRRRMLEQLGATGWAIVVFEAPHRLNETALDLEDILGPQRRVVLARELTKLHEQIIYTSTAELARMARDGAQWQGEITLVIGPGKAHAHRSVVDLPAVIRALKAAGMGPSKAAKVLAAVSGMDRSEAYKLITGLDDDSA